MGVKEYLLQTDSALLEHCIVDHYRSSGPGGQKRNKTSSAVRLRHQPTGLSVTATENRSQHVNLVYALRRLREGLALEFQTPLDPENYQPSALWSECVSPEGSIRISPRDPRYARIVHEILSMLAACGLHVAPAAERLGLSTGRLVKLLRGNPKLWKRTNELRAAAGLPLLRA